LGDGKQRASAFGLPLARVLHTLTSTTWQWLSASKRTETSLGLCDSVK
jgi:hypothetical protein